MDVDSARACFQDWDLGYRVPDNWIDGLAVRAYGYKAEIDIGRNSGQR